MHDRYYIHWVGRYKKGTSDKLWGWFSYSTDSNWRAKAKNSRPSHCYAFWCRFGKTVKYTKHDWNSWTMDPLRRLVQEKMDKGYGQISVESLEKLWPKLYEDMDVTFVPFLLTNY